MKPAPRGKWAGYADEYNYERLLALQVLSKESLLLQ